MRTRLFPLALLAAAALAPASAAADDVTATIPAAAAARNLSGYGGTLAWSQLAADGSSHLVVKVGALAPAEAPIRSFAAPVDPDVGPRPGGGAPVVVYARCATPARCDVYRYDPSTAKETKVTAVSKAATSESAPSTWKGAILFARSGGRAPGAYLYRPGNGTRRLDAKVPAATDVNDPYAAMLVKHGSQSFLRFSTFSGTARTIAQDMSTDAGGSVYGPPSLTRYYVYWRANDPVNENSAIERIGIRRYAGRWKLQRAARTLPAGLDLAVAQTPSGVFSWFVPDAAAFGPGPTTTLVTSNPPITFG